MPIGPTAPDDEASSNITTVRFYKVVWLSEGQARAEGKQDLRIGWCKVCCHRLQTPQEALGIAHGLQVDDPRTILHDAFAIVDFKAARFLLGRRRGNIPEINR